MVQMLVCYCQVKLPINWLIAFKYFQADLINWDEPVLWQVGHMGAKYHDWVDDPVDRPLRLFKNNFVEFFSNTPW